VRPRWITPRPAWLTGAHVGAVAVQDRPARFTVGAHNASPCLLTANFACRRAVFDDVGMFSPAFPRGQDRELQLRMWRAGKHGVYRPDVVVVVEPPPERLTRAYHLRWQATTAHYHALMWYRESVATDDRLVPVETVRRRSLFGTPLFMYRELFGHAWGFVRALVRGDATARFFHLSRLCYSVSFIATRMRQAPARQLPPRVPHPAAASNAVLFTAGPPSR